MSFLSVQTNTGIYILDLSDLGNLGQENGKPKFVKEIHLQEDGFPISGTMCSLNDSIFYLGGVMVRKGATPVYLSQQGLDITHGHQGISPNFYQLHLDENPPLQLHSLMTSPKPSPITQVFDDKLYVLAGDSIFYMRKKPPAPAFEVFDPACDQWSPLEVPPFYLQSPVPCIIDGHFVIGRRLYISTNHGDLWYYDTSTTTSIEPRKWQGHDSLIEIFQDILQPGVDDYLAAEMGLFARHATPINGQAYVNKEFVIMFSFQQEYLFAYLLSTDLDHIFCYQSLCTLVLGDDVVSTSKELRYGGFVLKRGDNQTCVVLPFIDVSKNSQFSMCTAIFNWKMVSDHHRPSKRAKHERERSTSSPPRRDFLAIDVIARETIDLSDCVGGIDRNICHTLIC